MFVFLLFPFLVYNQVLSVRVVRSGGHQRHAFVVHSASYDLHLIFQEIEPAKCEIPLSTLEKKNVLSSHKVWPGSAFINSLGPVVRKLISANPGLKVTRVSILV